MNNMIADNCYSCLYFQKVHVNLFCVDKGGRTVFCILECGFLMFGNLSAQMILQFQIDLHILKELHIIGSL